MAKNGNRSPHRETRMRQVAFIASLSLLIIPLVSLAEPIPRTGKEVPELQPLDDAVVKMMWRHGIPGAALAVAKDGKLLLARGYGWSDLESNTFVKPDTVFGIASLSKPFTAAAILKLVEQGKLKLEDKPFVILAIKPFPGVVPDPRLEEITVRQLLLHAGGWNAAASGDPINWTTQVQLLRGDRAPVSAAELISFTMGVPLDFDPGTAVRYSNFGYIVLGEVIAKVSGQSYEKYVQDNVLKPAGITHGRLHAISGKYFPNEARRYIAGSEFELPPWRQKYADAAGGWTMSAIDLVRFMTALDGSRGPRLLKEDTLKEMLAKPPPPLRPLPNGTYPGLGWDSVSHTEAGYGFYKDGSWIGMRAYMKRSPSGVCSALLFNASMNMDALDKMMVADAVKRAWDAVEKEGKLPRTDLFE
jgi:CubicO group peptidase (beta-lactamase class C family)